MGFDLGTWMGVCPGTWMAGTWIANGVLPKHMDGVFPGHINGVLPGHMDGGLPGDMDEVLPGHMDGGLPGDMDEVLPGRVLPGHLDGCLPRHGEDAPFICGQNSSKLAKSHDRKTPSMCPGKTPSMCPDKTPSRTGAHSHSARAIAWVNIEVTPIWKGIPVKNLEKCAGFCPGICPGKCQGKRERGLGDTRKWVWCGCASIFFYPGRMGMGSCHA